MSSSSRHLLMFVSALCVILAMTTSYLMIDVRRLRAENSDLKLGEVKDSGQVSGSEGLTISERFMAKIKPVSQVEFSDGNHLMLMQPMEYRLGESDYLIIVPAGFVHDRASVPPIFRSLMSTHGRHGKAAIVHDYLYWAQPCTQLQADNLMYIAMLESKVSPSDMKKVEIGLSIGGKSAFKKNKLARESGDFRVVPEHHRDIGAEDAWPDFHARLKAGGVGDPGFEAAPEFCSVGNQRAVPRKA